MSKGSKKLNTGKPYEKAAEAYFRDQYSSEFAVTLDVKVPNKLGGTEQIDLLLESSPHPDFPLKIAVEAKDYGRRLTKKDARDITGKFEDAGVQYGIVVCANGYQSGAIAILDESKVPITRYIKTREELIEGAWSDDFLDAVPRLREAKVAEHISDELAKKVILAIEVHGHYARYFFNELDNEKWVPVLHEHGAIERGVKGPATVYSNLLATFICKFAGKYPDAYLC